MTDIVERLRRCENDPMWAHHAEIPKHWCKTAADEIEKLRTQLLKIKQEAVVCQHLTNRSQTIKEAAVPWTLIEAIRGNYD